MIHSAYGYQKENHEKARQEDNRCQEEVFEEDCCEENRAEKSSAASELWRQKGCRQQVSCEGWPP